MPVVRIVRQNHVQENSAWLKGHRNNVTSQYGEDGILNKIFETIGEGKKWCVEFGAWDGKKYSNTFDLIASKRWNSVQIEGNKDRFRELLDTHGNNSNVHCICAVIGFNPKKDTIEHFLRTTPIPVGFDLISIDIDGNDYHIWESIKDFRPRVVLIEFNAAIPNDVVYVQDRNFDINQGSSLMAMVELGKKKGYELVATTNNNAFFVVKEEFTKFKIKDNQIDAMHFAGGKGRLFLLYDGTIVNCGLENVKLRQRDPKPKVIGPFDFQVYPPEERYYGGRVPVAQAKTPAIEAKLAVPATPKSTATAKPKSRLARAWKSVKKTLKKVK
jgi:hypothetical protein